MHFVSLTQSQVDRMNTGLDKVNQRRSRRREGALGSNHGTGVAPAYFSLQVFSLEEAVEGHVDDAKL